MTTLAPVAESERLAPVDTLRGVAVLGILAMNILAFAQPFVSYFNPAHPSAVPYAGEFAGGNFWAWLVPHVVFDQKMMTLFSMLFGAGLVLMGTRARADAGPAPAGFARVYYRRLLWLFAMGMAHAYAIWFGDILVTYAIAGLVLYPLRRLAPAWLFGVGIVLISATMLLGAGMGVGMRFMREQAWEARAVQQEGGTLTQAQEQALQTWSEMSKDMDPTPDQTAEQVRGFGGAAVSALKANAKSAAGYQLMYMPMWGIPRALGVMLLGMGLMKLGVLSGACSRATYLRLLIVGYGVGFPLIAVGAADMLRHEFSVDRVFMVSMHFNSAASVPVALGHASLVMLVCRSGAAAGLRGGLAAVGRMALTNYLMQSLICTAIFYGWGLGLFGRLERAELFVVVAGVWAVELLWSPWWLARFRFGPAEWLWRSLTYGQRQPMRRAATGA